MLCKFAAALGEAVSFVTNMPLTIYNIFVNKISIQIVLLLYIFVIIKKIVDVVEHIIYFNK